MRLVTLRRRNQLITLLASLYLIGAVGYRVASKLGFTVDILAPLFLSLPGGLAGATLYAAWTGLRGRRQTRWGMGVSGALGVILFELLETRLVAYLSTRVTPGSAGGYFFFGRAVTELICDLSAIVILFALFLSVSAPFARRRALPSAGNPPPA